MKGVASIDIAIISMTSRVSIALIQ